MTTAQQTEIAYRMNLAGFEKLIEQCTGLGKAYKPSDTKLKLTALNKLKDQAVQAIKKSREQATGYLKAFDTRSRLDRDTRQLTKRIMKALIPPPAPDGRATKMSREEWAKRERPKPSPFFEEIRRLHYTPGIRPARSRDTETEVAAPAEGQIPLTHREWYREQATVLADLAGKIRTYEGYAPDTDEIKPDSLQALSYDMQQKNEAIETAAGAKKQADEQLHSVFYDAEKGLVAIANQVKAYIMETTEADSDTHRLATVIMFHKP